MHSLFPNLADVLAKPFCLVFIDLFYIFWAFSLFFVDVLRLFPTFHTYSFRVGLSTTLSKGGTSLRAWLCNALTDGRTMQGKREGSKSVNRASDIAQADRLRTAKFAKAQGHKETYW